MIRKTCVCAALLAGLGAVHADDGGSSAAPGTYLSAQLGGGRIDGGNRNTNPGANRWMRSRAGEMRVGRPPGSAASRIDVVYVNEGHPDNNHRDGFALQWAGVLAPQRRLSAEFGIGPYLSMNTTTIAGRELDDTRWGALFGAALRLALSDAPDAAHLRLGYYHAAMPRVHQSNALMLGIGRQYGQVAPDRATDPAGLWLGLAAGAAITSMPGTHLAHSVALEASHDGGNDRRHDRAHGQAHWAWSAPLLAEGDDGVHVDRRGIASQLWCVQEVRPRFFMSAGIGPYPARNLRQDERTRANLLISLQAERALSPRTRIFFNFERVKTFLRMDDRDLFLAGIRQRF